MATEIVVCPVHPGKYPDDSTSTTGQVYKDCLEELTSQPGFQRLYWGRESENPDTLRMFVDWDDIEAHHTFMNSPQYKGFTERLGQVLDLSKLQLSHVKLTPHPPNVVLSDTNTPATEIVTVYFPTSHDGSAQDSFHGDMKKLVAAIESGARQGVYTGSAGGWVHETVKVPEASGEHAGERAKAYVLLIGWESVEAHMAFRETDMFKQNIHLLREAKGKLAMTVVHASCVEVSRGGGVGDVGGESAQEEVLNPMAGGKQSVKTAADGSTSKNDPGVGGVGNALKKERAGR